MTLRWAVSVDQNGNGSGSPTIANQGMGYFPGYAIDVNTGTRLNVFFAESSWDKLNNGDDMVWNPTADFGPALDRAGGRHYVYVHNSQYDGCAAIRSVLAVGTSQPVGGPTQSEGLYFQPGATLHKFQEVSVLEGHRN